MKTALFLTLFSNIWVFIYSLDNATINENLIHFKTQDTNQTRDKVQQLIAAVNTLQQAVNATVPITSAPNVVKSLPPSLPPSSQLPMQPAILPNLAPADPITTQPTVDTTNHTSLSLTVAIGIAVGVVIFLTLVIMGIFFGLMKHRASSDGGVAQQHQKIDSSIFAERHSEEHHSQFLEGTGAMEITPSQVRLSSLSISSYDSYIHDMI